METSNIRDTLQGGMSEERSLSKIPKVGIKRVTTKLQTPFPGGEREFSPFLGMLKAEKKEARQELPTPPQESRGGLRALKGRLTAILQPTHNPGGSEGVERSQNREEQ